MMSNNLKGSLFMMFSMVTFAVEDMFIKAAAQTVPIGLVLVLFGLGGTTLFVLLTWKKNEQVFHPALFSRPILIRASCEIVGRLTFALAITLTALSSASAILQATPLVVAVGAAVFFKERVGIKRWIAITIGFVGVVFIIRPSVDGFDVMSLFAVIATLGFAGRDLATRAAPMALSHVQLGVYGFFVLIPAGLSLMFYHGDAFIINFSAAVQIACATVIGVIAYYSLTIAMRTGEVSVVSPFRYTRLVFAIIIGMVVFGETPDWMTMVGSLLIVSSGGYFLIHHRFEASAITADIEESMVGQQTIKVVDK
ncbi:DMT family transporter [Vibrio sp. TH_r3]|uniref:DMT family transporter n=1 Tax=Vibrio sp. TH_r3 TaxID=3082084 RepID=UPI0029550D53|nr:DMT family transporter [Vibrio sp. TH_r3]MDV7105908.1 DMT family transporter [Vibrio sp. TH_r3]